MRNAGLLVLGLSLMAIPSRAQTPAAEVSVGYSYFRLGGSNGVNLNGGSGSLAYNFNNWVGGVADFGVYRASTLGENAYSFLFGPRFSYREKSHITPFAQALLGGAYLTTSFAGVSGSTTPFAWSFGGGVDYGLTDNISVRPQVDYIGLRANVTTTNCVRVSGGVVFRFGRR